MRPTVGDRVHYTDVNPPGAPVQYAAIITSVEKGRVDDPAAMEEHDYKVSLKVATTTEWRDFAEVPFSMIYAIGCWSWPQKDGDG